MLAANNPMVVAGSNFSGSQHSLQLGDRSGLSAINREVNQSSDYSNPVRGMADNNGVRRSHYESQKKPNILSPSNMMPSNPLKGFTD